MALIGSQLEIIEKMPGGHTLLARRKELIRVLKDGEAELATALKNTSPDVGAIIERIALSREELRFVNHKISDLREEIEHDGTSKTITV
jgi:septal ring factor EnvC (AmiA/AmiB activator)